jgi:hypothetical protein
LGYRGKVRELEEARRLRAESRTLVEIAEMLGVAKSSVSVWVRDVEFVPVPRPKRSGPQRRGPRKDSRIGKIEAANRHAVKRLGCLDEHAFLAAGAALYAGEGSKGDGNLTFANTDAGMMRFFFAWLRSLLRCRRDTATDACVSPRRLGPGRGRSVLVERDWCTSEPIP